jgi:Domain of unknown function DUF29.
MPDGRLYDTDWYAWTQEQASALRRMAETRVNSELDLENLAEEVESLGRSEENALDSALTRVIEHLLKLEHSPAPEPRKKWRLSVIEHRNRAQKSIRKSGSLRRLLPDLLPDAWKDGRTLAASALELFDSIPLDTVPTKCPYTLDQILDDGFYPANRHGLD